MEDRQVYPILNRLLAGEARSFLPRLAESMVYVDAECAQEFDAIRRMAGQQVENIARLTALLVDLGGEPKPAVADIMSGDFHYNSLEVVLPRVQVREQELLALYESTLPTLVGCDTAHRLAEKITVQRRADVTYIRQLIGDEVAG